jgi:hypothetical protein
VGLLPVGWVEPRNPTIPTLTEQLVKIIEYRYIVPSVRSRTVPKAIDIGAVGLMRSARLRQRFTLPNLQIFSVPKAIDRGW